MAGYAERRGWYLKMMGAARAKMRIKRMTEQVGQAFPDAFLRGGAIIAAEAKRTITRKGHVLTGALRGSIHEEVTDWRKEFIEITVGTWLEYARKIENLPDGGYLFESFERKRATVLRYIENDLRAIVRRNV